MRRLMMVGVLAVAVTGCAELGLDAGQLAELQGALDQATQELEQAQQQAAADQQDFADFWQEWGNMEYQGPANTASPYRPPLPPGGTAEAVMQFALEDGSTLNAEGFTYDDPLGAHFDDLAAIYDQAFGPSSSGFTDESTGWRTSYWRNDTASATVSEGPTGVSVTLLYDEP